MKKILSLLALLFLLSNGFLHPLAYAHVGVEGGASGGSPDSPPPENPDPGDPEEEPKEPEDPCSKGEKSQPISLATGHETTEATDLTINGQFDLIISRRYESNSEYDSPLGYGWSLNHDRRLYENANGNVTIRFGCGRRNTYILTGGAYVSPTDRGRDGTLTAVDPANHNGAEYRYTTERGSFEDYDTQGRLIRRAAATGHSLVYTYSTNKQPLTGTSPHAIDPNTPMITGYHYQLLSIAERSADDVATGNVLTFTYNTTNGRLQKIQAQDGRVITFTQDAKGNLVAASLPDGMNYTYAYADPLDPHNITTIQKGDGTLPWVNTYDTQDRVTQQKQGNHTWAFTYVIPGVHTSASETITDAAGLNPITTTSHTYFDSSNRVNKYQDALGNETTYTRNDKGRLTSRTLKRNTGTIAVPNLIDYQQTQYVYDNDGHIIEQHQKINSQTGEAIITFNTYTNNRITQTQTYSNQNPTRIFETNTTYFTDANGNFTQPKTRSRRLNNNSQLTNSYTYDAQNRLTTHTMPDGTQQIYSYTSANQSEPSRQQIKIGATLSPQLDTRATYNSVNQLQTSTDARGNITSYSFDARNRLLSLTNPLAQTTALTYSNDVLTQINLGKTATLDGEKIRYSYDGYQRLIKVERASSATQWTTFITYTRDSAGRILSETDADNRTTSYQYNAIHQRIQMTDALGNITQYAYDPVGNLTQLTDPNGNITLYTYDGANRLIETREQGITPEAVTTYTYDAVGNLLTVTDANQHTTTYTYDLLSRLTKIVQPLGQSESYQYDKRDRMTQLINANNQKIQYTYNAWGPLDRINYYANKTITTAERSAQYSYDVAGNITSILDNHLSPTAQYNFQYDALNRLSQQVANYLPTAATINYTYDNIGNRESLTLIDGQTITHNYTYNLLNQLTQAALNNQTYNFTYFNNDTLKTITYPNSAITTNTYQNNGPLKSTQLKNNTGTQLGLHQYTYDANDNILTQQTSVGTQTYQYDGLNRLIQATHAAAFALPNEAYQYDGVGNRTQNNTTTNLYDNNNRITKLGATTITHNNAGSLTQNGTTTYTYNSEQRLTQTVKGGVTTQYLYDAFGRRVKKTSGGTTTFYLWDNENLIAEYSAAGQRTKRYAYIPNRHAALQIEDANGIYNVHTNHLDTPTQLTDSTQKVVWTANYQAFGNTTINQDPDANGKSIVYNQRFPGQYADAETGLYYNFYRDYDPATGRYLQSDPIGLNGGINLYGYVAGNPMYWIDALGLKVSCTYSQSTGRLKCKDDDSGEDKVDAKCYAGSESGGGKNKPEKQGERNNGPLPRGDWGIGKTDSSKGPLTIDLHPKNNNDVFKTNRDPNSFRVHGDSSANPGNASEGCIICNKPTRETLSSEGGTIKVTE